VCVVSHTRRFDLPDRDMLDGEESRKEVQLMLECYAGIPSEEDIREFNDLQRLKVRRCLDKYGWCYGVNINLHPPYHPEPIFRVQKEEDADCDALLPPDVSEEKLKELSELIRLWSGNSTIEEKDKALDKILTMLDELGAVSVNWY